MSNESSINQIIDMVPPEDRMQFMELLRPYVTHRVIQIMRLRAVAHSESKYNDIEHDIIVVCRVVFGVTDAQMRGKKRTAAIVLSRQVAMWAMRELTPCTFADISRRFNRDHATVLHSMSSVRNKIQFDTQTRPLIFEFCERMGWRGHERLMQVFQKVRADVNKFEVEPSGN